MIRKKAKTAFYVARYYYRNIRNASFYIPKHNKTKHKQIYIVLKSVLAEPYYFNLLFYFSAIGGYEIILHHNFRFIGSLNVYAEPLLKLVKIGFKKPQKVLMISDKKDDEDAICITADYYQYVLEGNKKGNQFVVPYGMHPGNYINGEYEKVKEYRLNIRKVKVFFSGNQNAAAYSNPILVDTFQKLTRYRLIQVLEEKLGCEDLTHQFNESALGMSKLNKVFINKWSWSRTESKYLESRVENSSWLKTLSKADFFIAASGVSMPLCFNLVEAMAVGTIPILQHPEHLYPPLTHQKNALVFTDEEDLIDKIQQALSMSEQEIIRLRQNVIEYYDMHMAPASIIENFNKRVGNISELIINQEYPSYTAYRRYLESQ